MRLPNGKPAPPPGGRRTKAAAPSPVSDGDDVVEALALEASRQEAAGHEAHHTGAACTCFAHHDSAGVGGADEIR